MSDQSKTSAPEGIDFIAFIGSLENKCDEETRAASLMLGEKSSKCLESLGTVLSLCDRLASCFWGCRGGDHDIEYLASRAVASTRAALRLGMIGYYDESLSLTRSVGEIANLLALFVADGSALSTWKAATRGQRINDFGPKAVRDRVTNLGAPLPISGDRYKALCELATHVTPDTRPEGHNPLGQTGTGGRFRKTSYLLTLNEAALPIIFVGLFVSKLVGADRNIRERISLEGRLVAENIGGVNIVDGYPRLASEAVAELRKLVESAPPEDRAFLREAILRMVEEGPENRGENAQDKGDPAAQLAIAFGEDAPTGEVPVR